MHPDLATITDLFNMPRQYAIPIFQRGYVWSLEKQVAPLWFDILDRANAYQVRTKLIADGADANELKPLPQHFLGSVVISSIPRVSALKVESFEVIDGQQRMTTLHIFLKALYDISKVLKDDIISKKLSVLLKNSNESENDIYKVLPTQAGVDEIKLIDGEFSVEEIAKSLLYPRKPRQKNFVRPLMIEAYLYFYGSILTFVQKESEFDEEKESDSLIHNIRRKEVPIEMSNKTDEEKTYSSDRLEALYATIQSLMTVMLLTLGKTDDPQVIFETLNARGEPLLASDLIRNFVFLYAAKKGLKQELLYKQYWNTFDSIEVDKKTNVAPSKYWREMERQGRLNHPRIDLFFYNYLIVSQTEELKISSVFTSFKDWWQSEDRKTEEELKRLVKVAGYFQQYVSPSSEDTSRSASFTKMLRALDVSTFVPVYLFLKEYYEGKGLNEDYELCLDYIESYLVRRTVCNLTAKNYNKLGIRFLASIKTSIADEIRKILISTGVSEEDSKKKRISYTDICCQKLKLSSLIKSFLDSLDGDSTLWPDDELFKQAWLNKPVYDYLKNRKVLPILMRIEKKLLSSSQENITINGALSIEHVLPQTYKEEDYPLPTCAEEDFIKKDEQIAKNKEIRWNLLNSFGNLTLLTQTLNSSVSNGPFHSYTNAKGVFVEGKRRAISGQSLLKMNSYFQKMTNVDWNEEQILIRGNQLFTMAIKLWSK